MGTPSAYDLSGFRQGLKETGFIEGPNLKIEYRWANDNPDRLPELAADLVNRRVRVIAPIASIQAARAAAAATNTIPIVFGGGGDPVALGLVGSINRPGGNVTGLTSMAGELIGKQLAILHDLLPQATRFGVLSNPQIGWIHDSVVKDAQTAASTIGVTVEVLTATKSSEIDAVFAHLASDNRVQGLLVTSHPLFLSHRVQLAILAARLALPAISPFRETVIVGGLMSYGPDLQDRDREQAHYVGRILKGESPADLPVQQVSKFALAINVETAKAIGLTVPPALLATADEVIE
jgi:putative ABC transport system substrate-binding protein